MGKETDQPKKRKARKEKNSYLEKGGTRKGKEETSRTKKKRGASRCIYDTASTFLPRFAKTVDLSHVCDFSFPSSFLPFFTGLLFVFIFWESVAHARGENKTDRSKKTGRRKRTFVSQYFPVTFSLPARQPVGCYVETPL